MILFLPFTGMMSITTTAPLTCLRLLPEGAAGVEPEAAIHTLLIITVMKIITTTTATTTMVTVAATKSRTMATMSSRGVASVDQGADPEGDVGQDLHGAGLGFLSVEAQEQPEEAEQGGEEAGFEGYVAAVGM